MRRQFISTAYGKLLLVALFLIIPLKPSFAEETVRFGYLQSDLHHLAFFVATEKGFFRNIGAKVEIAGVFRAGPEMMSAFATDALDIGYVGAAPTVTATANAKVGLSILAQANLEGSALVIRKDGTARSLRDLRGNVIAIPGHSTVQDFLLGRMLRQTGMTTGDVQTIVMKPPEMIGALDQKQIDGFIAWEPHPAKAVTMGVGKVLLRSGEIWPDHPCCVLVVSKKFSQAHPEIIRNIVQAHVRATRFIRDNPAESLKIAREYTGMDEKTVKLAIKNIKFEFHPAIEGLEEYVQYMMESRYIKIADPSGFSRGLVDKSFLYPADK